MKFLYTILVFWEFFKLLGFFFNFSVLNSHLQVQIVDYSYYKYLNGICFPRQNEQFT
jgi:hypothetical protein